LRDPLDPEPPGLGLWPMTLRIFLAFIAPAMGPLLSEAS
jgi:hypothetical protein